jgi:putative peptide zinc metalloprotease protein
VQIPGVLTSSIYVTIYPSESAQIISIDIERGQIVERGQALIVLRAPELDKKIEIARNELKFFKLRAMRAVSNQQDQDDLHVILEQIAAKSSELEGLEKRQKRLVLRAPFSGIVAELDETLVVDQWVKNIAPLFFIMDPNAIEIKGIASESELKRIEFGQQAIFYPEDALLPTLTASVNRIDWGNIKHLEMTYLASQYGGDVAVKSDNDGLLVPESTAYAVHLGNISATVLQQETRGDILITGEPISFAKRAYELVVSVLIRESGF